MRTMKSIVCIFLSLILAFSPLLHEIPLVYANAWKEITFTESISTGSTFAGTSQASYNIQLWHYSGGYWGNTTLGLRIEDSEMKGLYLGMLEADALNKTVQMLPVNLPEQVIKYLDSGGTLEDIEIKFICNKDPLDLFKGNPKYIMKDNKIQVEIKPQFQVQVNNPVFANDKMNVLFPQIKDGFGNNVYSIFTRSGTHLGMNETIRPNDILNEQGHLVGGKQYTITTDSGASISRDGSEIKIGNNTFSNGGAVGLDFKYPITAHFYIKGADIPKSTAEFEIHYQGKNVTDNHDNPITVDKFPFTVNLVDKSTTPTDTTITKWEWQGNSGSSWVDLSTQQNPTDSVTAGWKAFRLRVTNNKGGVSDWKQHDVYAQLKGQTPGPPPETPPEAGWEIVAKLKADPYPRKVTIGLGEYNKEGQVNIQMDLDASESTATKGIKDYLFYYRVNNGQWVYLDWRTSKKVSVDVKVSKSNEDANKKIPIQARVAVRDTEDNVRYGFDSSQVELEIVTEPPESKQSYPSIFYPKQITDINPTVEKTVTWDYFSQDDIPYKHSIVSKYKLVNDEWTPLFIDKIQTERTNDIIGLPDEEYKLKTQVVDEYGNVSDPDENVFIIQNASPIIKVTLNTTKKEENLLGVSVENLTPILIETTYPTTYTNWIIYDSKGTVLEQGLGKVPEWINLDNRYHGNTAAVVQYAENILGNKTKDFEVYYDNSILDFLVNPNRLFEMEMARVTDLCRAIENKVWSIRLNSDGEYTKLVLDENNEFTKDKGKYTVKLDGHGNFAITENKYIYSNTKADLRLDPPNPTQAEIQAKLGSDAYYVYHSTEWHGDIETSTFVNNGITYKHRRRMKYMILQTVNVSKTQPVEFLDAKPVAKFTTDGFRKMYKKITLNGTSSIDVTDAELQAKYPIQFDDPRTMFKIEPLKGINGDTELQNNKYIQGYDKEIENNRVVFKAKDIQHLRFDLDGIYKIWYKVFNGLKESDWVSEEINISPELQPSVDINVSQNMVYRDPNNKLKSKLDVIVDYSSSDDEIDLEESKLLVFFDTNHDENFENDGEASNQWVMKDNENLLDFITVLEKDFKPNQARFSFCVDNEDKNILGRFKFEFVAIEKPLIPNYIDLGAIPLSSVDTFNLEIGKKLIFIENQKPVIELKMKKENTVEIWIIDEGKPLNINTILDQLKLNRLNTVIYILKPDGSVVEHNNF